MLGRSIDKIVKEYLVDWLRWVGHNGTQASWIKKKVFVQKRWRRVQPSTPVESF